MGARRLLPVLAAALLCACGGGESPGVGDAAEPPLRAAPATCDVADLRAWLRGYMRDQYFWMDSMRPPDEGANGTDAYFRSMLDPSVDRYSYTQPVQAFDQFYREGSRTGYGYTLVWADAAQSRLRVRQVEPHGPAAAAGLRRGDIVVSIDGLGPQAIAQGLLPAVNVPGVARRLEVLGADGALRQVQAQSATFKLASVASEQVIPWSRADGSPRTVAYFAYHEFIVPSETHLDRVFRQFIDAGANELVLDLRYNGGGDVMMARGLASMIGGQRTGREVFADFRFNARHAASNFTLPMTDIVGLLPGPPLQGLERVYIITSAATASASELLINALRPFMPVVLVGETTFGKPYGFQPRTECGVSFSAVAFETLNARGQGRFTDGFAPACDAADDLDHALGDVREDRLAAALHHVRYGSCPQPVARPPMAAARARTPPGVVGESAPPAMLLR